MGVLRSYKHNHNREMESSNYYNFLFNGGINFFKERSIGRKEEADEFIQNIHKLKLLFYRAKEAYWDASACREDLE